MALTDRQNREVEFHRARAAENEALLEKPFSYEVLECPSMRWWNACWRMYDLLVGLKLAGKKVMVVGCGFGDDALCLAKLGADVSAFDLSPESISIARRLAERENLNVRFDVMAAEALRYDSGSFDCVVARDILHHVELPVVMTELARVAKPGAAFVASEVYTHSIAERMRRSKLVEKVLYPAMRTFVYGRNNSAYITEDERKLTERDIAEIKKKLGQCDVEQYFNFVATRILPGRVATFAKIDRVVLMALKPIAHLLGGRCVIAGKFGRAG